MKSWVTVQLSEPRREKHLTRRTHGDGIGVSNGETFRRFLFLSKLSWAMNRLISPSTEIWSGAFLKSRSVRVRRTAPSTLCSEQTSSPYWPSPMLSIHARTSSLVQSHTSLGNWHESPGSSAFRRRLASFADVERDKSNFCLRFAGIAVRSGSPENESTFVFCN